MAQESDHPDPEPARDSVAEPETEPSSDVELVPFRRGRAARMPRWRSEEVDLLRERYPSLPNVVLARELHRTVPSIVAMAQRLHLKKTPDRLKEMGRQNVSVRYARV